MIAGSGLPDKGSPMSAGALAAESTILGAGAGAAATIVAVKAS